ncbi:inositol monophosphatase family protein [Isachenkonia alkalipeptolytica]|uniref:inositol-phosphate phosphatase n=1 Tax=Isachenkonia alkalipeptolytica TaxID=2565777 RepID=A0AA44BD43_9CLOT|nr:inositol monophosphatase family protein [Isachenkonia alkalipeptolytica]NBG87959.1 inositol monophosphatase [Isachenkonia alkalipeptolytica]
MENIDKMLVHGVEVVKKAGEPLRAGAKKDLNFQRKDRNIMDIVTEYDHKTERFIIEQIHKRFPGHGFIAEEGDPKEQGFKKFTWVIDPIDGTTNFVNLGMDFAISVALYVDQEPYAGIVYDVMKDEMMVGVKNQGVWVNDRPFTRKKTYEKLNNSILEISFSAAKGFQKKHGLDVKPLVDVIRGHRNYGVASLTITKVAKGELEGYISGKLFLWDYAAAGVILRELGGEFIAYPEEQHPKGYEIENPYKPVSYIGAVSENMLKKIVKKLQET